MCHGELFLIVLNLFIRSNKPNIRTTFSKYPQIKKSCNNWLELYKKPGNTVRKNAFPITVYQRNQTYTRMVFLISLICLKNEGVNPVTFLNWLERWDTLL